MSISVQHNLAASPRFQPASLVATHFSSASGKQTKGDVFDPNRVHYDPKQVYSQTGNLSISQKICTFLIKHVYHPLTRGKYGIYKYIPIRCMFKEAGKLSCSEFTMVAIQELGPIRGILHGFYRILRCNPVNKVFWQNTTDPVFSK